VSFLSVPAGNLSAERQAKIKSRAEQLIGEEMALRQVRKARKFTQEQMARVLHVGQDSISRIESRSDLLVSTLKSYIEAMGGKLRISAEFKNGFVILSDISRDDLVPRKIARRKKPHPRFGKNVRHLALTHTEL
jgi:transcriptional regulator with XRE-family HTH domain